MFYCLKIPPIDIPFSKGIVFPLKQKCVPQFDDGKVEIMKEEIAGPLSLQLGDSFQPQVLLTFTTLQMHEPGLLLLPTVLKMEGWTSLSWTYLFSLA